jgi:phosphatidylglycerophosphate synthase
VTLEHAQAAGLDRRARAGQYRQIDLRSVPARGLIAQLVLLAVLAATAGLSDSGWIAGAACAAVANAALARGLNHYKPRRLGAASCVTLARASLAIGIAALVASSFERHEPVALLVSLAAVALVLDAVDGWVARRTTMTAFGAKFDGETDAFLILVLSVYVARWVGAWVLAIGAARYLFLAGGWALPCMRAQLPARPWRKCVAAAAGIVLAIAAARVLPNAVVGPALAAVLVLIAESFGRDIWWLTSTRDRTQPIVHRPEGPGRSLPTAPAPQPRRRRRVLAAGLTILAALAVWAVLAAPDQPNTLTASGFVRIPLEGLVLVLFAVVLPPKGRRVLAVIAGLALTLVALLKIANYEIFRLYARPFDPLSDITEVSNGTETLRLQLGGTETTVIEIAAIVGTVVGAVLLCLAMLRLTRVASASRRNTLRVLGLLGGVWALCWAFGAQLVSSTPVASTASAALVYDDLHKVQQEIHDHGVFAKEIRDDPFKSIPSNRLLTALRGKDVVLVFIEAYGQEAVQGTSFSPGVDDAIAQGNKRLASSGFSSRSGFLTSATFGGLSWLAHSTLESGLWVDSQLRYSQLLAARRLTLADAFKRAGWRTVGMPVENNRPWPEGKAFYHWDKIYDRYQLGYHGPQFGYAAMTDQFTFLALQRLELGKKPRRPLFAEVDTVSSHEPWERIPEEIGWDRIGNGSIYKHLPQNVNLDPSFWTTPTRVQAAYGRSIVYALTALTSFVQHYGKKNLVMIVLGDHQPLPVVSGFKANHDVPISIIAHDPSILKRIRSWGWGPGLRPSPNAPVWPMSAFRNRFFNAFDSQPAR